MFSVIYSEIKKIENLLTQILKNHIEKNYNNEENVQYLVGLYFSAKAVHYHLNPTRASLAERITAREQIYQLNLIKTTLASLKAAENHLKQVKRNQPLQGASEYKSWVEEYKRAEELNKWQKQNVFVDLWRASNFFGTLLPCYQPLDAPAVQAIPEEPVILTKEERSAVISCIQTASELKYYDLDGMFQRYISALYEINQQVQCYMNIVHATEKAHRKSVQRLQQAKLVLEQAQSEEAKEKLQQELDLAERLQRRYHVATMVDSRRMEEAIDFILQARLGGRTPTEQDIHDLLHPQAMPAVPMTLGLPTPPRVRSRDLMQNHRALTTVFEAPVEKTEWSQDSDQQVPQALFQTPVKKWAEVVAKSSEKVKRMRGAIGGDTQNLSMSGLFEIQASPEPPAAQAACPLSPVQPAQPAQPARRWIRTPPPDDLVVPESPDIGD